ncbi:hypothetical protein LDENG_00150910 [Lucifuga dentata]|nr:hypothetical protein LDENG_00150910 [Lucifuga dentata]
MSNMDEGFFWKLLLQQQPAELTFGDVRVGRGSEAVQPSGRFHHHDPAAMSDSGRTPVVDRTSSEDSPGPCAPARPPLAEKALSEAFVWLRYRDASMLIWQQQQAELEEAPPSSYLSRSQSAWYSSYGNQAVLVRDKKTLEDMEGRSRICSVM